MILAVNIGNTNITLGISRSSQIISHRIATDSCIAASSAEYEIRQFFKSLGIKLTEIKGSIISSVVPEKNGIVTEAIRNCLKADPVIVTADMDFDLDISSYDCSLVGTDRLLCCMAAYERFNLALIVYDLGTATTANVVNDTGAFLGGAILPGIETGLKALTRNTSLLPDAVHIFPVPLIGNNTNECLISGALHGTAGFIDNYTQRVQEELHYKVIAMITGGNAPSVIPLLKTDYVYCPELLMEGLMLLYSKSDRKEMKYNENQS